MKHFFLLLLLVFPLVAAAQSGAEKEYQVSRLYTAKALQEDFMIFRKALETTYPSLYRYSDSTVMNDYLNQQGKRLNKPMTEPEFYKVIALACARVNDEHLIPTPSREYYTQEYHKKGKFFPFAFKILNRRFYLLKSAHTPSAIPLGSEIVSINGRPVEEILNILLPTIPSDGYIQTFNIRHLEDYSLTQNENLFDLNYPLFVEKASSFRLEFIPPGDQSALQTKTVPALNAEEYRKFYRDRVAYGAPLTFKYLTDEVAYLKIGSFLKWHRNEFKQNFDSLYQVVFGELKEKRTPHLILDLRNNEGGDYTGEELIAYLLQKPYRHFDYAEEMFVGTPAVSEYLENKKDIYFIDSIVYKTGAGTYRLKKECYKRWMPLLLEQQPKANHYGGQLIVLANGASGSMASVVCSFLKSHNRATFIGEETGGAMEGPTSLAYAQLKLPNTHIRVEVPLTKTVNAVKYTKGRGVMPDYPLEPAIEDLTRGIDTELKFAIELIKEKPHNTN